MNLKKDLDVTALGELLIDFTECGFSGQGNPTYEANPGGAPCNVLSMLTRLGRKVAFIGKVGDDIFGRQLTKAVVEQGIDIGGLRKDSENHTTLAFVEKLPDGDRDFSFYRKPGADMSLLPEEVDIDRIRRARIFHFGTLSLTDEPVRSATREAVHVAEESGCIRSFDPNLRPPLWESEEEARRQTAYGLEHCDVLKIADNEIRWFTDEEDFDAGLDILQRDYPGIRLICLSMGPEGSLASYKGFRFRVPAFLNENTIETTGAGDTFGACVLDFVLEHGLDDLSVGDLRSMLVFANAAASVVTTRRGALRVMPTREEVEELCGSVEGRK